MKSDGKSNRVYKTSFILTKALLENMLIMTVIIMLFCKLYT